MKSISTSPPPSLTNKLKLSGLIALLLVASVTLTACGGGDGIVAVIGDATYSDKVRILLELANQGNIAIMANVTLTTDFDTDKISGTVSSFTDAESGESVRSLILLVGTDIGADGNGLFTGDTSVEGGTMLEVNRTVWIINT